MTKVLNCYLIRLPHYDFIVILTGLHFVSHTGIPLSNRLSRKGIESRTGSCAILYSMLMARCPTMARVPCMPFRNLWTPLLRPVANLQLNSKRHRTRNQSVAPSISQEQRCLAKRKRRGPSASQSLIRRRIRRIPFVLRVRKRKQHGWRPFAGSLLCQKPRNRQKGVGQKNGFHKILLFYI